MSTIDNILKEFITTGKFEGSPKSILGNTFTNETILITGAAGSIGSEITRLLSTYKYKKLILLDIAESALYELQQELISKSQSNFEIVICDIRNADRLENIFTVYKPTIVLHIAAYKHVPLMESNPYEAITVNILGTCNVSKLSIKYAVNKFVFISSDKAVNPTSIMGATKRIAELYINYLSKFKTQFTQFITIRFGNVLGSSGSVVPLFKKQIENGGPITLTHEAIDRYFLPLSEACQLILETTILGSNNQVFIFDMGVPLKIIDLAKKMIELSGLKYPEDIDIQIVGIRPGEKLNEDLFFESEIPEPTNNQKVKLLKTEKIISQSIESEIISLCNITPNTTKEELILKITKLVPEYLAN